MQRSCVLTNRRNTLSRMTRTSSTSSLKEERRKTSRKKGLRRKSTSSTTDVRKGLTRSELPFLQAKRLEKDSLQNRLEQREHERSDEEDEREGQVEEEREEGADEGSRLRASDLRVAQHELVQVRNW